MKNAPDNNVAYRVLCISEQPKDGQKFVVDGLNQPEGFCAWAWRDIHKAVLAIRSGSNFTFMKKEGTIVVACTDGIRPVIFKVERIEDWRLRGCAGSLTVRSWHAQRRNDLRDIDFVPHFAVTCT